MAENTMTKEEIMAKVAELKNTALPDSAFEMVSGGVEGEIPESKFNVGDRVKPNVDVVTEAFVTDKTYYREWMYTCRIHVIDGTWQEDVIFSERRLAPM